MPSVNVGQVGAGAYGMSLAPVAVEWVAPPLAATITAQSQSLVIRVEWGALESESPVRDYTIEYKVGEAGAWTSWLSASSLTSKNWIGSEGQTCFFRARARDWAGNQSAWVETGGIGVYGVRKYYQFAGRQVGVRQQSQAGSQVFYLHTDHLGSTSLVTDGAGAVVAQSRYLPFGEVRWQSGVLQTDRTYTGQRSDSGLDLIWYGSRWYDSALGRFISPDSIIPQPGNPLAWDRYSYVYNNPVNYNDPTGHYACGDGYEDQCLIEQEQASYQIAKAGLKPEVGCSSDPLCSDSYKTFIQVTMTLGRVPTMSEILMMTAATEYFGYSAAESTGQEGLARNYYEFCDTDGCSGGEIYKFFSGFQPWYGRPYVKGDGSPSARAGHLINSGLHNRRGEQLKNHADDILNSSTATYNGWIYRKEPNEPWQWYGPFLLDPTKNPTFGYNPSNTAILSVDLGKGYVFWMFTGEQDRNFNLDDWRVK